MKKWVKLIFSVLFLLVVILIYMKVYYPPLPINSVSKSEAINKVNKSNGNIVKFSEEYSHQWYISEMKQGKAYDNLKKMMEVKGWGFKEQVGSGFVFQNEQGEITVLSEMWTKNYVIFHLPKEIN
ncbi:hypothetical protein [Metabacillus bambusae]|uniref:DUF4930 domain-containing protein n=1 Tax=Metabacillus bambusae TaxID=2795218 RepID=A0ABS3N667_9BACI|nr:hypothetical protein [Metabacillus bambusae]MBO1513650.1 hypothetical protein [Metabacillus bambusae]